MPNNDKEEYSKIVDSGDLGDFGKVAHVKGFNVFPKGRSSCDDCWGRGWVEREQWDKTFKKEQCECTVRKNAQYNQIKAVAMRQEKKDGK